MSLLQRTPRFALATGALRQRPFQYKDLLGPTLRPRRFFREARQPNDHQRPASQLRRARLVLILGLSH